MDLSGKSPRGTSAGLGVSLVAHALLLGAGILFREGAPAIATQEGLLRVTLFESPQPAAIAAAIASAAAAPADSPTRSARTAAPPLHPRRQPAIAARPLERTSPEPLGATAETVSPNEQGGEGDTAVEPVASAGDGAAAGPASSGGLGSTVVLPFGPGMTRPQQIEGEPPAYTRSGIAARVEGKVLVRCVISVAGSVDDCQVLKSLPLLDEVVLSSLARSRFRPVTYQGHPQAIRYVFSYNFKLP